ncbi:methyl-accepting chemotaxis protein [Burkholderia sp. Bp9140]|uniref:methyl-accepting chemotaxis protein n=1 Tax=Burkholderia sp. Bp9140 TaxID=2184572 RepID=UPI0021AB41EB|nr:methyl-accepting chemotaxis protein [Burkholderia sp. Bp9140]
MVFLLFQGLTEGLGLWALIRTQSDLANLSSVALRQVNAVNDATQHLMDARINLARAMARVQHGGADAVPIVQHASDEVGLAQRSFNSFLDTRKSESSNAEDYNKLNEKFNSYSSALNELVQDHLNHNLDAALAQPTQQFQDSYLDEARKFIRSGTQLSENYRDSINTRIRLFEIGGIGLTLTLLLAVALLRFGLQRSVVAPLNEVGRHFERIAKGHLDEQVHEHGKNEIGRLFSGLQTMQQGLARIVISVREASNSINLGAREIAAGNADLSSRTEMQAASLEQTASSMEELTVTVRHNAQNAVEAKRVADEALSASARSTDAVRSVVEKMHSIEASTGKITAIVSVIDSIAFQTNILALNASVEAARAATQGRGFAVVANEVRSLAQRSAQSAKEIKLLVNSSVGEIKDGSTLAERAGEAMNDVASAISRVGIMISEISTSSTEQRAGIEQVNTAVTHMDRMTQQNAALVEQAAATAVSLSNQTRLMTEAVSVFRTS